MKKALTITSTRKYLPKSLFCVSGHFSLPALLLHLVSGVGLLTLTATIVDILTLYILPDKLRYRRFVYEESPIVEMKKNQ